METTHIELTPEQRGLLTSLSQATGKSPMDLIEEALEGLQEQVQPNRANGEANGSDSKEVEPHTAPPRKHIWEIADELFDDIPEEELERLPTDGAAQHDHYIYGTPKRSE
jgi:hypothetical protein